MAELYFSSNYTQTLLPDIRDIAITTLTVPNAVLGTVAGSALVTADGLYGKFDVITRVGFGGGTVGGSTLPDCTVQLCNAAGVVGTLYTALGTSSAVPGDLLGAPLGTTAWICVVPSATFSTGRSLIVDYVHEA